MLLMSELFDRFPAPPTIPHTYRDKFRRACMAELETQANTIWQPKDGTSAIAVSDFDRIVIPPNPLVNTALQDEDEFVEGDSADVGDVSWLALPTHRSIIDVYARRTTGENITGRGLTIIMVATTREAKVGIAVARPVAAAGAARSARAVAGTPVVAGMTLDHKKVDPSVRGGRRSQEEIFTVIMETKEGTTRYSHRLVLSEAGTHTRNISRERSLSVLCTVGLTHL